MSRQNEYRRKHWTDGITKVGGENRIPLAQFPKCKEDIEKNWDYLEQLRAIFYPDPGRLDRTVESISYRSKNSD